VVLVPLHNVGVLGVMLTVGVGFTVIVILALFAVVGLAQVAFEVSTQLTACPFVNVVVVKMFEFVPAFVPFTFH